MSGYAPPDARGRNGDFPVNPPNTRRLSFRRMKPSDLDLMAEMLGDPDVMHFYPAPKTREEAAAWISWNEANYERLGYGLWIIETHGGTFVGDCGLTWQEVNGEPKLEVGYHVVTAQQGRGYATEALGALLEHLSSWPEVRTVVAETLPDNHASIRVLENNGFVLTGRTGGEEGERLRWARPLHRPAPPAE